MKQKNKTGFTLIEMLVVIAVIGLLATTVLVSLNSARAKARDAQRLANKKQVITALNLYYQANNAWPPNEPHGNGAGNGYSCFAPFNAGVEKCWSGFYEGSDALVAAMVPYLTIFPKNNADSPSNAYNRILYNATWPGGVIFGAPATPAGAHIIWMQERAMTSVDCPSNNPVYHFDAYYYCVEFIGPP